MKSWSWGNYPLAEQQVIQYNWLSHSLPETTDSQLLLPYGCGRSYGDVPINHGGSIIATSNLNRFISFDPAKGILQCEAGITLSDILAIIIPQGWFLPVTPGTQFVTLGGAIANDVHGKNHHQAGTFGQHILAFNLLRSEQDPIRCSLEKNSDLFKATIGGLGLTGLVTLVELQLIKINSDQMEIENIAFKNIDEGLDLFEKYDCQAPYTVAWIDCLSSGDNMGRGIFSWGKHSNQQKDNQPSSNNNKYIPVNFPGFTLNKCSVKAFNEVYFRQGVYKQGKSIIDYQPFFYPLDKILHWNRIYGKKGFFQYQCVVPYGTNGEGKDRISEIIRRISVSGNGSFLAVLKRFGDIKSPGILSFPMPGITLALDFPNKGKATLELLNRLDDIVRECGGRVYPAKDARMSVYSFQTYFPEWKYFSTFIDKQFSSSFWRRVTGEKI